jgi:hypothetical protein
MNGPLRVFSWLTIRFELDADHLHWEDDGKNKRSLPIEDIQGVGVNKKVLRIKTKPKAEGQAGNKR